MMEVKKVWRKVGDSMADRLSGHRGLSIFARERAKFEGWLKVELCDVLLAEGWHPTPEDDRIDVTFESWAIELKTCNTNYGFKGVKNKGRPITKNVSGVISDIRKLNRKGLKRKYNHRAVVFVMFPMRIDNMYWQQKHLPRIAQEAAWIDQRDFVFENGLPGVLYFALCEIN